MVGRRPSPVGTRQRMDGPRLCRSLDPAGSFHPRMKVQEGGDSDERQEHLHEQPPARPIAPETNSADSLSRTVIEPAGPVHGRTLALLGVNRDRFSTDSRFLVTNGGAPPDWRPSRWPRGRGSTRAHAKRERTNARAKAGDAPAALGVARRDSPLVIKKSPQGG
jgi:hypothetical protein